MKTVKLHNRGKDNTSDHATGAGYKCDLKPDQMTIIKTLDDLKKVFETEFGDSI